MKQYMQNYSTSIAMMVKDADESETGNSEEESAKSNDDDNFLVQQLLDKTA